MGFKHTQETKIIAEKRQKMYYVLRDMKTRCYNVSNKRYYRYGGRGINICQRWLDSLDNFIEDMGYAPKDLQIDRIDNDKDYSKENCRWATRAEQNANRGGKFSKKDVTNIEINKNVLTLALER